MNAFQRLILLVSICGCAPLFAQTGTPIPSLSGTADGLFYIGAAVEPRQLQGREGELLKRQVNTLTAENAMKMYALWTGNDSAAYRWAAADRIVDFARENSMKVRGHTLIWHNAPAAFFKDENGNDLDSAALYRRTEAYMRAVLTHFDSTVFCWDVVNEAIAERNGEGSIYRQDSPWYRICGADYIAWAFRTAHRIRPDVKLFYNDYNLVYPDKLQRTLTMLRQLLAEGVPIDGVGMQAHWNNAVTAEQIQAAVDSFAMLGLDIHITELDLTIYGNYHDGARQATTATLPYDAETSRRQAEAYARFFEVFRRNSDKISSVTLWGIADNHTWLNNHPVKGRRDYPLLFDTLQQPKEAFFRVIDTLTE